MVSVMSGLWSVGSKWDEWAVYGERDHERDDRVVGGERYGWAVGGD